MPMPVVTLAVLCALMVAGVLALVWNVVKR